MTNRARNIAVMGSVVVAAVLAVLWAVNRPVDPPLADGTTGVVYVSALATDGRGMTASTAAPKTTPGFGKRFHPVPAVERLLRLENLLLTLLRRLSPQDRGSFATVRPAGFSFV